MEKKRDIKKEPVLTLLLLISGVMILSWVGQATGYASYIQERSEVRGFTESHSNAWSERGEIISERYANTALSTEIKRSAGEVVQETNTGYFVRMGNRIIFITTTQSFKRGDGVTIEYGTKEGKFVPLGMSKA